MLPRAVLLFSLAWVFSALAAYQTASASEKRLALVVTNAKSGGVLNPLTSPHKDGERIVKALKKAGFDVRHERDLDFRRLSNTLTEFRSELRKVGPNAVSFLYYSGHGAADTSDRGARNFLIPIDSPIEETSDLPLNAVGLNTVICNRCAVCSWNEGNVLGY